MVKTLQQMTLLPQESLNLAISTAQKLPVAEPDANVNQNLRNAMFHLSGWLRGGYGPYAISGEQLERFVNAILYSKKA